MNYSHFPGGGTRPVTLYLPVVHTLSASLVIILTYFRARASCRHSPLTFIEALSAKLLAPLAMRSSLWSVKKDTALLPHGN